MCLNSVLNVKVPIGAFNQRKALAGALSVIVKTNGSFAALVIDVYLQVPVDLLPDCVGVVDGGSEARELCLELPPAHLAEVGGAGGVEPAQGLHHLHQAAQRHLLRHVQRHKPVLGQIQGNDNAFAGVWRQKYR